uniref:Fibronectin type-III domain-containing protein n=1 Tax=Graphocephala atropunctata TaxID=36148 RepID=A0A1B6MJ62_9HEMI
MINSSSTSAGLKLDHPNLANGIIRTFVVSVEETEQFDQDSCCQVYPLVEITVTNEKIAYYLQVSGLHPASMYVVSVSAKTVGLGPSQSLVVVTRPPHLPFTVSTPQSPDDGTLQLRLDEGLWLPQIRQSELNNSDLYAPLIMAHLLLVVPTNPHTAINDSCVLDQKLATLIHSLIEVPFWFYKEYDQEYIGESDWGRSNGCLSLSKGQEYRIAAVQVTEYNGHYNADLCYYNETKTF